MFIAHRGLHNKYIRENSISAFDNAFNNGYDGIELDVRLTKDKIPVIIHDSFISRVSDGMGLVKKFTYDELQKFNIGINSIERIPKLNDVLNRYHNRVIFIELKEKIDITKYLNDNNDYYIMSYDYDYIKDIPKSNKYKRGIISYIFNNNLAFNLDFILLLNTLTKQSTIQEFIDKNIEVIIYGIVNKTINNNENIKYII